MIMRQSILSTRQPVNPSNFSISSICIFLHGNNHKENERLLSCQIFIYYSSFSILCSILLILYTLSFAFILCQVFSSIPSLAVSIQPLVLLINSSYILWCLFILLYSLVSNVHYLHYTIYHLFFLSFYSGMKFHYLCLVLV